jgi:sugar phosphate isomerase/epimerase
VTDPRSPDPARLSLNTATIRRQWGLGEAIAGCARHGIGAIAPWRDQLQALGVLEAASRIRDHGLRVSSLCRGGFFTADDALNLDDNRRAVDEAAAIGAECLVLVVGGLVEGTRDLTDARRRVADGIAALGDHARARAVRLAIEPLHPMYAADRGCINTLRQALDLCERLGPDVGVAVDSYHVWWDPELEVQIARAGAADRILAYHVCDWLVPTEDLRSDRGMPGDGVIELRRLRGMVEAAGYDGCCEIEIFSEKNWWRRDPDEVLRVCVERYASAV